MAGTGGGRGAQRARLGPQRPFKLLHSRPPRSGRPPAPWRVRAAPAAAARGPRRASGGAAGSATCWRWRGAAGASFLSGTSRDWRLGVASQLPRAATVTSQPQPGPLGARAAGGRAGGRSSPAAAPNGRAPRPRPARARAPSRRCLPRRQRSVVAATGESAAAAAGTPDGARRDGRGPLRVEREQAHHPATPGARGFLLRVSRRQPARLRKVTTRVLGKDYSCGPQGE